MNKKTIGIVLLAVASFSVGLASAQAFFRLFKSTVPPVAMGSFQIGAAHGAFLVYGVVLSGVILGFGILICILNPLFRGSSAEGKSGAASGASSAVRK